MSESDVFVSESGVPPVEPYVPVERREPHPYAWPVLVAISAGGVLGALARHGLQTAFPHPVTGFPWATFGINVSGCLLIGILMILVTEVWPGRVLVRPFLGVGVLGGFTTFSTYVLDIQQAAVAGAARTALAYLALTLVSAMLAVWAGATVTGRLIRRPDQPHESLPRPSRSTPRTVAPAGPVACVQCAILLDPVGSSRHTRQDEGDER